MVFSPNLVFVKSSFNLRKPNTCLTCLIWKKKISQSKRGLVKTGLTVLFGMIKYCLLFQCGLLGYRRQPSPIVSVEEGKSLMKNMYT